MTVTSSRISAKGTGYLEGGVRKMSDTGEVSDIYPEYGAGHQENPERCLAPGLVVLRTVAVMWMDPTVLRMVPG
jgi:hypothetical protein